MTRVSRLLTRAAGGARLSRSRELVFVDIRRTVPDLYYYRLFFQLCSLIIGVTL